MKSRLYLVIMLLPVAFSAIQAQEEEFKPKGSVYGKVFVNFNTQLTDDGLENSTFELKRGYLGYKYDLSKEFTTRVLLDVGKPDVNIGDTLEGETNFQMTAFLKEASLTYKKDKLTLDVGLIGLLQHKVSESLWGHRYVAKPYQDQIGICHTADLGIQAQYKVIDMLTLDFVIRNGGGFRNISQDDNAFRSGGGFTLTPIEGVIVRGYYDFESKAAAQTSISHTIGYSTDLFTIGAEYSFQLNNKFAEDHTLGGYSVCGSYNITDWLEVFARYDMMGSNKPDGYAENWNNAEDYSLIIGGVQFTPLKNIDVALDYQSTMYTDEANDNENLLFVHFQYSF